MRNHDSRIKAAAAAILPNCATCEYKRQIHFIQMPQSEREAHLYRLMVSEISSKSDDDLKRFLKDVLLNRGMTADALKTLLILEEQA